MSYELIAILMFSTMMLMLLTGQRVFGAIGVVAVVGTTGKLVPHQHRAAVAMAPRLKVRSGSRLIRRPTPS